MSTSGSTLAKNLGRARDAFGVIEGAALAMRESVERDIAEDHFSDRFYTRLENALSEARAALDECYEAVDDLSRSIDIEEG